MSKKEWKESGTELGHAFKTFGKTFLRSVDTTTDKVVEWANEPSPQDNQAKVVPEPNSTVYSDGSWKKVGKELGNGFLGVGKTMLHTVGIGTEGGQDTADSAGHHEPAPEDVVDSVAKVVEPEDDPKA
ncbi:MAG: hypothetical protein IKR47_07395 [Lachnospiraceae bacterium]|nr:hypothetical protein [Lachnospiraceae bacterium]